MAQELNIFFDRDWVEEVRKEIGNPVRNMEKKVRTLDNASVVKSGYNNITIQIDDEHPEDVAIKILEVVIREFPSLQEEQITVGGINDLDWKYLFGEEGKAKIAQNSEEEEKEDSEEKPPVEIEPEKEEKPEEKRTLAPLLNL